MTNPAPAGAAILLNTVTLGRWIRSVSLTATGAGTGTGKVLQNARPWSLVAECGLTCRIESLCCILAPRHGDAGRRHALVTRFRGTR